MTLRRLWVLVSRLPPQSATQALMSGLPGEGLDQRMWGIDAHLLAGIHEQLQMLLHLTGAVHAGRGRNSMPKPTAIPRPGVKES